MALESTGVYWKPVYYVLEDAFELLLINMLELKRVPGRKTDVKDSEWLAQLLECGLLRSSFVPPPPIRELRELTRYRKTQIDARTREIQRLAELLEDAGVKQSAGVSDLTGASATAAKVRVWGVVPAGVVARAVMYALWQPPHLHPVGMRAGLAPALVLGALSGRDRSLAPPVLGHALY